MRDIEILDPEVEIFFSTLAIEVSEVIEVSECEHGPSAFCLVCKEWD